MIRSFLTAFAFVAAASGQDAVLILKQKCQVCHNNRARTSGFSVESREAVLAGGNRGAVVNTGKPAESILLHAINYQGDLKMPPTERLTDDQIATITKWIEQGLPWTGSASTVSKAAAAASYWAFVPPKRSALPPVKNAKWARNPIDNFILARLEKEGLAPSPEADKLTLLRRVSLDLTGLPPTAAEIDEFLSDKRPDAYERVVDRLLTSPHYGERWGRHWLDVARYADSNGYNIDGPREIWKYRDWVIDAFNRDLPFDQFTIDQIAGDLEPNATTDQIIATGFNRNTPLNLEGGIDFEQYRVEAVVDRVSTTGAAFLGLTLGCARCHDHKFDPISQREFYQFYAFFNNIDEMTNGRDRKDAEEPVLVFGAKEEFAKRTAIQEELEKLQTELSQDKTNAEAKRARIKELRSQRPQIVTTLVMRELAQPRDAYIQLGGDFLRKGAPVKPGVLAVLPPLPANPNPNRLDLAKWLVSPQNPLTARVTVNRMWQMYFGKGIVDTENDFGKQGSAPTHPELLDFLALEFMGHGWSQKSMHKLIVTSATYRQSSRERPEVEEKDPQNLLLARQNRIRLDAEVVRDTALVASGLFNPKVGGPGVYPPIPDGALAVTQIKREWPVSPGAERYRRGMYTFFWRSAPYPGLIVFDAPDATATCTRRNRSNTPLQALTLLNDEAFYEFAEALGARIVKDASDDRGRVVDGFKLALGRAPKPAELDRLVTFAAVQDPKDRWTAMARVLLNLDEFMTRD